MPPCCEHWRRFKMKQWPILRKSNVLFDKPQLRCLTPQTSMAESESEADNYGGARLKMTQRFTIRSPQVEAVTVSNNM